MQLGLLCTISYFHKVPGYRRGAQLKKGRYCQFVERVRAEPCDFVSMKASAGHTGGASAEDVEAKRVARLLASEAQRDDEVC